MDARWDAGRWASGDGEEPPALAEQTRDDTDAGWGERPEPNDERLWSDRPPHWE